MFLSIFIAVKEGKKYLISDNYKLICLDADDLFDEILQNGHALVIDSNEETFVKKWAAKKYHLDVENIFCVPLVPASIGERGQKSSNFNFNKVTY